MYGVRIGWSQTANRMGLSASSRSPARSRTGWVVSVWVGGMDSESLGGLQPDPLAKRLPFGRQPATLRRSHNRHTAPITHRPPLPTSRFKDQERQVVLPASEFDPADARP